MAVSALGEAMPGSDDIEALRLMLEECRLRHERQIAELRALETRTSETIRSAGLVIGVVVAAAGVAVGRSGESRLWIVLGPAAVGVVLLVLAMIAAVRAYRRPPIALGIGNAAALADGPSESEALRFVAETYDAAAVRNQRVIIVKSKAVTLAMTLMIAGLVALGCGCAALMLVMGFG